MVQSRTSKSSEDTRRTASSFDASDLGCAHCSTLQVARAAWKTNERSKTTGSGFMAQGFEVYRALTLERCLSTASLNLYNRLQ